MIGYIDCSTGVSGDKFLGALLDVGTRTGAFTAEKLTEIVRSIVPDARPVVDRVTSHGIAAVGVRLEQEHDVVGRTLPDIEELIARGAIPDAVRVRAISTFQILARAEARVHGTDPSHVHFHEVGALDAIMDIVGVCAGLQALGITHVTASPGALGSGTVTAAHGVLPVPAPATTVLLEGVPVYGGDLTGELTTPTGAALLRTCVDAFGPCPALTPEHTGHGAGTRDIGAPNVCRLIIGEPAPTANALATEDISLLETNVDHLPGEEVAFAVEQLLAEGVLDAWLAPVLMKKGRPGYLLSSLVLREDATRFAARIAQLTGTLGVRRDDLTRYVAEREVSVVDTEFGEIRVKIGSGRVRPEHEDVARIARTTGMGYRETARLLEERARRTLGLPEPPRQPTR